MANPWTPTTAWRASAGARARPPPRASKAFLRGRGHDSGLGTRIAGFIASTCNGQVFPFDLDGLRMQDEAIADDMPREL